MRYIAGLCGSKFLLNGRSTLEKTKDESTSKSNMFIWLRSFKREKCRCAASHVVQSKNQLSRDLSSLPTSYKLFELIFVSRETDQILSIRQKQRRNCNHDLRQRWTRTQLSETGQLTGEPYYERRKALNNFLCQCFLENKHVGPFLKITAEAIVSLGS